MPVVNVGTVEVMLHPTMVVGNFEGDLYSQFASRSQ